MDIPTLTVLQLDYFLAKIENATRGQKIAQFIGAMASVLDYNAEENRTYEQLQKKIQVRTLDLRFQTFVFINEYS